MSKKPKEPSKLIAAASVLQSLLANGKSPLAEPFKRWKLWRYWETVVGPTIAEMSVPVELHRGRLVIWAKSSGQLQDLHFMAETIKLQVNRYLGGVVVHSVRFTLDEKRVPNPDQVVKDLDIKT